MAFNIAVDRYEVIVKRLQPWFDEENSHLYGEAPVRGEGVLIGCPVWGKEYIERFALYSLPSIGSPANLAALAGHCRMVPYFQTEARPVLFWLTRWLSRAGIDIQFRTIPDSVLKLA
jgi:hypothetical protein